MEWLAAPLGPLAGPECRRALRAPWLFWARVLPAIPALLGLQAACWIWWFASTLDRSYRPGELLSTGLLVTASIGLAVVLVFMPALTCGALSGNQSRAAGEVLLAAPVSAVQIVMGRLASRLCQMAALSAAALPSLLFFAGCCGVAWWRCLTFLAVLSAVAWGCGGLTLGLGASTRRARDALLSMCLLLAVLLLAHRILQGQLSPGAAAWLAALDPFSAQLALLHGGAATDAVRSMALWTLLGTVGMVWAAWRLRPTVLGTGREKPRQARRPRRALGDGNPLLWKDLHVERLGALHRLTARLGTLCSLLLGLAGLALAATAVHARWIAPSADLRDTLIVIAERWQTLLGTPLSLLLQWVLGARAAVSVAAERERGTWECLLVSTLEGRQIVWGKILASAYALRWLLAAALAWWTACLVCGAVTPHGYVARIVSTASGCVLMLAVGVWAAISVAGITRALALTGGLWLASLALFRVIALVCGLFVTALYVVGLSFVHGPLTTPTGQPTFSPATLDAILSATTVACEFVLWVATAWLVTFLCCRSFDRLTGREAAARRVRDRRAASQRP